MKFTVFKNENPMSFVCDGKIEPVHSSIEKDYVKGCFVYSGMNLVYNFQQGICGDETCELEDENFVVKGRYVTYSRIDKNPIIEVYEKKKK
jgi:hypothetical protein